MKLVNLQKVMMMRELVKAGVYTNWVAKDQPHIMPVRLLNGIQGLSFPVQSGHPCLGCSEPNFWDGGGFYQGQSAPLGTT